MSKSKTNVNDLLFKNMGIIKESDDEGNIELKKAQVTKDSEPAKTEKEPKTAAPKKPAAKKKAAPKEEPKPVTEEKVHVNFFPSLMEFRSITHKYGNGDIPDSMKEKPKS